MNSPFLDLQGQSIPQDHVIGSGGSALILLQNDVAVKTPLRYLWSSDLDVRRNHQSLQHEQAVYRRLQSIPDKRSDGIVRCIETTSDTTKLTYMVNGDLRTYLSHSRVSHQTQLAWFRDLARTLSFIHERRILVADIASRNFLLDSQLSIKFCDFSEASLLPLDSDMSLVDDNGFTTQIDIGLLAAVMYEVITGTTCEVDLFKDDARYDGRAYWPERKTFPATDDIWLGNIIERCWDGTFRSADSLLQALDSPCLPSSILDRALSLFHCHTKRYGAITITGTLGLVALALFGKTVFSKLWISR
ncbi:kinase-like domain-containing protein [Aspergillus coremiiformis]|uniref:Kinase-like domain-containing protein n=1 Tax=Aspergillus coremiiformis TaxID=138285 RepID=A0A5N6Z2R8_9EURO|nr:kinase-like domain-containing protein [Aspergillus coremiiformis]